MSTTLVRKSSERTALWIAKQTVDYGTAATTGFYRYREMSMDVPEGAYGARSDQGNMGAGNAFPTAAHFINMRKSPRFTLQGPCTDALLNTCLSLFLQNCHDDTAYFQAPTATHAIEDQCGYPVCDRWATVIAKLDEQTGGTYTSSRVFRGAMIRTLGITLPAASEGDDRGRVMINAEFVGRDVAWADDPTMGTPTEPTGLQLYTTALSACNINTKDNDIISMNINLQNNLRPKYSNSEPASLWTIGPVTGTVSLTVYDDAQVEYKGSTLLDANLALSDIGAGGANAVTSIPIEIVFTNAGTLKLYVVVMGEPRKSDHFGNVAWTYDCQLAYDGTNNPIAARGTDDFSEAMFYTDYTA